MLLKNGSFLTNCTAIVSLSSEKPMNIGYKAFLDENVALLIKLLKRFSVSLPWLLSYILCDTKQNDADIDPVKVEEYTAVLENKVSFDSVAGTYCGILPSNVETILTLNAYGTYLLARIFKEKQNEQEKCGSAYGGFVLSLLAMCGKLFQLSLWVAPPLSYCRIPSYRLG